MTEAIAERFWAEFESEASDHLGTVEASLMAFSEGKVADNVAPLFRALHSLKGLARVMGLGGMERTAHLSESVLHFVRDNGADASREVVNALLSAHDAILRQLSLAVSARQDQPPPPEVVAALEEQLRRLAEQTAGAVRAPDAAGGTVEHDEADEMLQLFGELLQNNVAGIAGLFSATTAPQRDAVVEALTETANAADVLQFTALNDTLGVLAAFVGEGVPLESGARRTALIRAVAELMLNIRVVEEVAGVPDAAAPLVAAAAAALGGDVRLSLAALARDAEAIEELARSGQAVPPAAHAALAASIDAAKDLMLCVGADHAGEVLTLLREACGRVDGHAEAAQAATVVADAGRRLAGAADPAGDAFATSIAELHRLLAGRDAVAPALVAGIDVGDSMRDHLDGDAVERLRRSLEGGGTAYRWSLFLEDAQETASTVIDWISREANPIHSRTDIRDGKSWFEFLLTATIPAGELLAVLARLDPAGLCIKKVVALDATPQGATVSDETAARLAEPAELDPAVPASVEANTFRVRSEAVSEIIEALGTLRSRLSDLGEVIGSQNGRAVASRGPSPAPAPSAAAHDGTGADQGAAILRSLEQLAERIEVDAHALQLVPLERVFRRLPRIVHALGQQQNKLVQLRIDHGDIRVDKAMVDALLEPMIHLITNAVDHGIERSEERTAAGKAPPAVVGVQARRSGGELVMTISDDGRGMNEDAIKRAAVARGLVGPELLATLTRAEVFRLTLRPGFSTAAELTNTSGRGVGLDVVANTIQRLGGAIDINSVAGAGTTFHLRLPLSRSLQSVILAEAGGQVYAFNERSVLRLLFAEARGADDGAANLTIATGEEIRVLALTALLRHPSDVERNAPAGDHPIVVIGHEHEVLGVRVARIVGRRRLALRASSPFLVASGVVAGATTLVNGSVVLLLDAPELLAVAREGRWRRVPA